LLGIASGLGFWSCGGGWGSDQEATGAPPEPRASGRARGGRTVREREGAGAETQPDQRKEWDTSR
jgi:hypothetical protein